MNDPADNYDIDEGDAETWKRRYEIANKRHEDAVVACDRQAVLAQDRAIELTDIRTFVLLALKEQGISSPLTTKELIGELVNQRDMARKLAGGGE